LAFTETGGGGKGEGENGKRKVQRSESGVKRPAGEGDTRFIWSTRRGNVRGKGKKEMERKDKEMISTRGKGKTFFDLTVGGGFRGRDLQGGEGE